MTDVHNPFSPPKAEVALSASDSFTEIPESRPTTVNIALFLIGVGIAITALRTFNKLESLSGLGSLIVFAIGAMSILVDGVLGIYVSRGRNWARIGVLVLCILSIAEKGARIYAISGMPSQPLSKLSLTSIGLMALPHLLSLAAVILLFGPGRSWFRKRAPPVFS